MDKQTIKILLNEYKELRDICEDYQKLLGEYKYLYHLYEQLTYCDEENELLEEKQPMGFQFKKGDNKC